MVYVRTYVTGSPARLRSYISKVGAAAINSGMCSAAVPTVSAILLMMVIGDRARKEKSGVHIWLIMQSGLLSQLKFKLLRTFIGWEPYFWLVGSNHKGSMDRVQLAFFFPSA